MKEPVKRYQTQGVQDGDASPNYPECGSGYIYKLFLFNLKPDWMWVQMNKIENSVVGKIQFVFFLYSKIGYYKFFQYMV